MSTARITSGIANLNQYIRDDYQDLDLLEFQRARQQLQSSSLPPQRADIYQPEDDEFIPIPRGDLSAQEYHALLPKPRQPKLNKLGKAIAEACGVALDRTHQAEKWLSSHWMLTLLALATAAPNALFAFTPHPNELKEAFAKMSKKELVFAFSKAASSEAINAILNSYFLLTAKSKVKATFAQMLESPQACVEGTLVLTLAVFAAFGAGALSYHAFLWLPWPTLLAAAPALISIAVNFASRLVGIKNVFTRIHNLVSVDAKVQQDLADKIEHINLADPEIKELYEGGFNHVKERVFGNRNPNDPLTDKDFEELDKVIARLLSSLAAERENFLREPTNKELLIKYLKISLQLIYCAGTLVFLAFPYGVTFTAQGRNGIHMLLNRINKEWGLESLSKGVQIALGLPSGVATFLLAASALIDTPNTAWKVAKEIYNNPSTALCTTALLSANLLAATGPLGVAVNVVEHNPFNLRPGKLGTIFEFLNAAAGFDINTKYTLAKAVLPQEITIKDVKSSHVLDRLKDPLNTVICPNTRKKIQLESLFNPPAATHTDSQHRMHRIHSAPGT